MFDLPQPKDDGLYIPRRPVGEWSRHKHYFLQRYIDAFTTAMKGKRWKGLHYIDLFAGPGIVRLRDSGELDWGSALIAAQAPNAFDGLHFCELSKRAAKALQARLDRIVGKSRFTVLQGDANQKVHQSVAEIPPQTLSLAFLDPYGLHLNYETVQVLSARRVDFIVFFPDHLDALRNCKYVYRNTPNSNLDRFLGPEVNWHSALNAAPQTKWAEVLRKLYCGQIRRLGYTKFESERICVKGRPLYLLIFCSQHPVAAKLWRGVSSKKPDDQRTFDFNARG
ncbi:MAG: three-Cys-motif partner protein TcmP [Phycisphaerales bacterium]|nr:MAG: three-Cys-motif partner protein TcmP [Phycisphaerales bacterium]